ncbi:MAG: esterase-like activity of phytase family protein [Chromatocurvus sp.]
MQADPVLLTDIDQEQDLPGAVFAGGWQLKSPAPAFGGLSGLSVDGEGNLLAVSDHGAFVWIELAGGAPVGARLAPMRDASGAIIAGGRRRDAEGLDLRDGLALVSFERVHRVLAFDLAGCLAAARGVDVVRLDDRIAGINSAIRSNAGIEGLATTAHGKLLLALEMTDDGLPLAWMDASGVARLAGRIEPRGAPVLTDVDRVGETLYAVLRSYAPGVGNTIEVVAFTEPFETGNIPVRRILRLEPRHGTDNFEGIALQHRDESGLRLWLVSDNNFSASQRTLLYAFDLVSGHDHHLAL